MYEQNDRISTDPLPASANAVRSCTDAGRYATPNVAPNGAVCGVRLTKARAFYSDSGLTLVELIVCVAILSILATAALPIARFQVKRQKERELRRDLWEMRDAIDQYKDASDRGGIQIKTDSMGYPPDLQTLVDGVEVKQKKVHFLRAIPVDPMTKSTDWGVRSNQDDADSDSTGGQNVFDVYTKSTDTALDGTKYKTW